MDDRIAAVELSGISKAYDRRTVLNDVHLTIHKGEFFAILGASGSGKSTLLKIVSGIENSDQGRVRLGSQDVTDVPPYRRSVHTVFQNYALFPHLDVAGNVGFPLKMAGVPTARRQTLVQRALEWVRLEAFARRSVAELSGGERQRVALARALVDEPECVLLDEPLSALDPHLRVQTLELLRDIQTRTGATYLYVTHDREEAMRAAHRIGVLREGRLAQVGTPEDLYRRPASAFVAGFIGKMNWLHGVLALEGDRAAVRLGAEQTIVCLKPSLASGTRVRIGIRPEDIRLQPTSSDGLRARVIERSFAGAVMSFRLELGDGTILAAEVRAENALPEGGAEVCLSWNADALHVFAETEDAA